MSKSESKTRLVSIYKILMRETDPEHYITIQQIIKLLEDEGVSAYRKTVIADIDSLIEQGIDIVCVKSSQNRYYINSNIFSLSELKLLVDAVEASQFITQSKSAALIGKLTDLTSTHNAEKLSRHIYLARRMKNDNEEIYDVIDKCYEGINNGKKISFLYYDYNICKERVLHNNGSRYCISPYGMTWEDVRDYLIGYSNEREKIMTFRADRMGDVDVLSEEFISMPDSFSITDFVNKVFRMEEDIRVTLLCKNELMKSVIDRFGIEV